MSESNSEPLKELSLQDALKVIEDKKTKLVWLGTEPTDYICERLGIKGKDMIYRDPNAILELSRESAKDLDGYVFVCYHGITSGFVAAYLQREFNMEVYHLKGGITWIIGEMQ